MEFRSSHNKVKLYRSDQGRRKMLGSFDRNAVILSDVPLTLRITLDDQELKQLEAWLRGAAKREARSVEDNVIQSVYRLMGVASNIPADQRAASAARLRTVADQLLRMADALDKATP